MVERWRGEFLLEERKIPQIFIKCAIMRGLQRPEQQCCVLPLKQKGKGERMRRSRRRNNSKGCNCYSQTVNRLLNHSINQSFSRSISQFTRMLTVVFQCCCRFVPFYWKFTPPSSSSVMSSDTFKQMMEKS